MKILEKNSLCEKFSVKNPCEKLPLKVGVEIVDEFNSIKKVSMKQNQKDMHENQSVQKISRVTFLIFWEVDF